MKNQEEKVTIKQGTKFVDITKTNLFQFTARYDMTVDLIQKKMGKTYFKLGHRICKTVSIVLICLLFSSKAYSKDIDMNIIYKIESSNNPKAYNKKSKAKGLGQITPIVLKEWNNFHFKNYNSQQLFNSEINKEISSWYMNQRIPRMLKYYKKTDNIKNRLLAYNCGIDCVVKKRMPTETWKYIKKYNTLKKEY